MGVERNGAGDSPRIARTARVHPTATIVGNVVLGKRVLVCPHAVLRADEPGPDGVVQAVVVEDECNIQDLVIVHALGGTSVRIGRATSVAHGAVLHGPCEIGARCFVGFNSIVFRAVLGDEVVVMHQALVEGVTVATGRHVASRSAVCREEEAARLPRVDPAVAAFVERVRRANLRLAAGKA